ncbi:amidase [Rhodococcus olei]|uniref:amidase n=1 Tax=Rhodococcus olei TaxID=2161675 RepID=A0ABP8PQF9_9NOCA
MTDIAELSARELLRAMRGKEISPVEVCENTLAAADAAQHLQAFITIDAGGALRAARESEARITAGTPGPLEGLPFPLKDVEATRGLRTTNGSPLTADNVPAEDGATAAAIRASGANIFGKTNTSAFAYTDDSTNMLGLTSRNPLDTRRSAGGSSGGAASAVAGGICRVAHATDGGGSARQPAALCGLVGFKPTYGRVPRYPMSDLWNARSHSGVIGRTVDDVAVAMSGMARFDPRDPLSVWETVDWASIAGAEPPRRPRIAYFPGWAGAPVDSGVERAARRAVDVLVANGCEPVQVEVDTPSMSQVFEDNYTAQLLYDLRDSLDRLDLIDDGILDGIERASRLDLVDFMASRDRRGRFNAAMVDLFDHIDFFVSPAQSCESWFVDVGPQADGTPLPASSSERMQLLLLFNLLGWPAISVPCGTTASGMPVGLQLAAIRGRDVSLLQMAYFAESLFTM